jgi:AAA domain
MNVAPFTPGQEARRRLEEEQRQAQEGQARADAKPFSYILAGDLKASLSSNDIVRDLVPRLGFGEVHADSGGGKTAIIVDLTLHIAQGREYRGRRVEFQPVVYVALEGHGGIDNRVLAARRELAMDDPAFALVKTGDNFRDPLAARRTALTAIELKNMFGGTCPVIVIDTFTAALSGGSDCDPKDVGMLIENIKAHLLGGCTVLLCHHFGKDPGRGGRGWSGLRAALDFELQIEKKDGDLRTMKITKSRDGPDTQPAFCYRFRGRELGVNEYGETVTAVVVDHLSDADPVKSKDLSPKARDALQVLWACIKDPSRSYPMRDTGLKCTLLPTWEEACLVPGAISKCKEERERRKQFKAAKEELERENRVTCDSEDGKRVYPTPKEPQE